jgi:hypothetical protein
MTTTGKTNDVGRDPSHRAMWLNTIRTSLERSVPIASDDSFDDLLALLDAMPAGHAAAAPGKRVAASLARRDAALEAQLSGHVDRLATAVRRFRARLPTPGTSPYPATIFAN